MADIKEILTIENDEVALSQISTEIDTRTENPEMRKIVSDLKRTMKKKGLKSLSAPAIGYTRRIFCIDFKEEIKTFINPYISKGTGIHLSRETCSSIPGKEFIIPRNVSLEIMYMRPNGQIQSAELKGLAACVFQHEYQHLDGVCLHDIGLEVDELFDNASEEEREEVISMYLDSLDMKQKELEKNIENDPDAKQLSDGIKYLTSVALGETKLEMSDEKE